MELREYAANDTVGLAELVRKGDVSAAELETAARQAIAAVEPQLHATVGDLVDPALEASGDGQVSFETEAQHQAKAAEATTNDDNQPSQQPNKHSQDDGKKRSQKSVAEERQESAATTARPKVSTVAVRLMTEPGPGRF